MTMTNNLPSGSGSLPPGGSGPFKRPRRASAILRPPTSVAENLRRAALALEAAHVDAPRLTAEVLLAHVSGLSRTQILARPEQNVSSDALAHFDRLVERALAGEPMAYIVGHREFCGLDFTTDARALVPRPETELLVELALKGLPDNALVADVGTGCGCIAVAIAVRAPTVRVTALDISMEALTLARRNAQRHHVAERLTFTHADLLKNAAPSAFGVICANLPYIPSAELDQLPVVKYEPRLALDGGPDGLSLIRHLLVDAPRVLATPGRLLLEIGATQGRAAFALAGAFFPNARVRLHKDLAGLDRVVEAQT
jgi:release factor glutamine methyltransferase